MVYALGLLALGLIAGILMLLLPGGSDRIDMVLRLIQEKRIPEAKAILNEELSKDSDNPRVHYYLAKLADEANDLETALKHWQELNRIGRFNEEVNQLEVNKKIASTHYFRGESESALEAYLDVLRIFPDDIDALRQVAFMSLGAGEFEIALPYLERVSEALTDDRQVQTAYAICAHEIGKSDLAISLMEKLLEKEPDDLDLNVLSILMSGNRKAREGMDRIKRKLSSVHDDYLRLLLLRMFVHLAAQTGFDKSATEFLNQVVNAEQMLPEIDTEIRYYLLFMALQNENFKLAANIFSSLEERNPDFRDLAQLRVFITHVDLNPPVESYTPFFSLLEQNIDNLIPDRIVFNISGLKTQDSINFSKFFIQRDGKRVLHDDFANLSKERAIQIFRESSPEEFSRICESGLRNLGLKVVQNEPSADKNIVDFVAEKRASPGNKVYVSFQRHSPETKISEIYLNNLLNKMTSLKAQSVILLMNAGLTEGAEARIKSARSLQVLGEESIPQIVQSYLYSKRKSA